MRHVEINEPINRNPNITTIDVNLVKNVFRLRSADEHIVSECWNASQALHMKLIFIDCNSSL